MSTAGEHPLDFPAASTVNLADWGYGSDRRSNSESPARWGVEGGHRGRRPWSGQGMKNPPTQRGVLGTRAGRSEILLDDWRSLRISSRSIGEDAAPRSAIGRP